MALLAFKKFLPADDLSKTVIHSTNMRGTPVELIVDHPYDKCQKGLWDYNHGASIQDAFSFLSGDEREFMQTGMTADEYATVFPSTEEDDEPKPMSGEVATKFVADAEASIKSGKKPAIVWDSLGALPKEDE